MTEDSEDETPEPDWGIGAYQAVVIPEPNGEQLTRVADAKKAGALLWANVCKELTRGD